MDDKPKRRKGKIGGDRSEIVAALPSACADENLAVEFLERMRWGDTPCCPHCGETNVRKMLGKDGNRNRRFLWRCGGCRKQYTVRVGTVYEESRIPLRHWCYGWWAACSSKKGVSAMQVKRVTGLNYRSALFMLNRIRHAMQIDPTSPPKLTGTVEADETYVGGRPRERWDRPMAGRWSMSDKKGRPIWSKKTPVFAVVQRGGDVRAQVMPSVTAKNLRTALLENVDPSTHLLTDESRLYRRIGRPFASHRTVHHQIGEYVKASDPEVHTNTIEGFFSLLKRKIHGTHHAVSKAHLGRYVAEAAFIYNNRDCDDGERTMRAIQAANGKRLAYKEVMPEAA